MRGRNSTEHSANAVPRSTASIIELATTEVEKLTETDSAIISGSVLGHVGLFEKWISHSRQELGREAVVIATGGYARYLAPYTKEIDYLEPNLTLIGINLLADEARVLEGQA